MSDEHPRPYDDSLPTPAEVKKGLRESRLRADEDSSEIVLNKGGGVTFAGAQAVDLFRAKNVLIGLRAIKKGLKLTKSAGKVRLLELASEYTEKKYKRTEVDKAETDLTEWIRAMECAMPIRDERQEGIV